MVAQRIGYAALAIGAGCLLLPLAAAEPDPPWNLKLVGQLGGWCNAVQIADRYAFVGEGATFGILDVSNPSSPLVTGQISFGDLFITDIQVKENTALVVGGGEAQQYGVQAVDVASPGLPSLGVFCPTPLMPNEVCLSENRAYVACGGYLDTPPGGIQILDISNPSSPTLAVPFIALPSRAWSMSVVGDIAYVACSDGLRILDITSPSQPVQLALYSWFPCYDALFKDGLVYMATEGGLEIVDVTSPTMPLMRGRLGAAESYGLYLSGDLAILAQDGSWKIEIIDITDPASPTSVVSFPTGGMAWNVVATSGTAYVANGPGGVAIVDITNASSPTLLASYDTLSNATGVYVSDDTAYVANGVRGLKTIDVSNPRSPRIFGSLATSTPVHRITISEQRAYLTYGGGKLYIIDVTTASSPALVGSYTAPSAWDVAVSNGFAYLTHNDGFQIVDVTDPSSPTLHGSFATPGWPDDIAVFGDLAFVADLGSLQIVDVSDPTSPFLRSSYPGPGVQEVTVSNAVAYITFDSAQVALECIDVTNPDAPTHLGMYDLAGYGYSRSGGLDISNDRAYVFLDGIRVLDISDPTAPTLCGFYPTDRATFASDLFANGDLVYLADVYGLRIFQFTGAAATGQSWPLYE